ncbi:MAG: cysteine desulfurase family protein [Eubacteriales bacterium]|nr:cysteine desulfurase family protein [Eubacteriales bacterium]
MNNNMVYLDNAATTRPARAVIDAVTISLGEGFFNPSALYKPSVETAREIERCRKLIKSSLQAEQVVFTSGGTEANNLAILGHLGNLRQGGRVLYSQAEHPSVKAACQAAPEKFEAIGIPLDAGGRINLQSLSELLTADTRMVCVMQVNNETGAIQPLGDAAELVREKAPDAWFHVDGVQGFLRLPMRIKDAGIDSYALSGHKIHGPKGIGALALGGKRNLEPRLFGGGQEAGLRSGTENTPGIAGLFAAVLDFPGENWMRSHKLRLYEHLKAAIPTLSINGPEPDSLDACDHIINLSFPPVRAETMLHAMEAKGVYVSHGSACSSRKNRHSETLKAMGVSRAALAGAIRFSLSPYTTEKEIELAVRATIEAYEALKAFTRR